MYYINSNLEHFARPLKPADIDNKTAWIVGSGLAGLSTAVFLVRDAQMPGENITILEELNLTGGALDGIKDPTKGYVMRGGREMEEHFECLWDMFRSIPSLEEKGASVLDEFYWLDKRDPNYSLQRATINQGQDAGTKNLYTLSPKATKELTKLFLADPKDMEGKRINEVLGEEFFKSNFWLYWQTMFAFQKWHSALEMKLYLHRFINHVGAMPDFSSLKFTRYNQYESLAMPLEAYLRSHGVKFQFNTEVTDVDFAIDAKDKGGRKQATYIHWIENGKEGGKPLSPDDLLFMTIGSLTENSDNGDQYTPAKLNESHAPAWDLWRKVAAKDSSFGHPDVFGSHISETKWMSATITTLDKRIPQYIQKICKRDPFAGKVVTGGIITIRDSPWLMSWTFSRQPYFKSQPKDQTVGWLYGLLVDEKGVFIEKPMSECTGEEITQEWLYHLGVPKDEIPEMAKTGAITVPSMMPYITAFFMPRHKGDRPEVVPQGSVNFAFLGQFAETTRDTIFTVEYSVRTGMESVYQLCGVDRGVPEVFSSTYDVRYLLDAAAKLRDGKKLAAPWWLPNFAWKWMVGKLDKTVVGGLLRQYHLLQ